MVGVYTLINLHLNEKPNKCLDCRGKLTFNGQSDFNIHVICETCKARFYYDKELMEIGLGEKRRNRSKANNNGALTED